MKFLNFKTFKFISNFVLVASCLLIFASHAFAAGFVPLAGIPGLTEGTTADSAGLAKFFNNLYKYLIGIAAILAVIEIIWAGIKIATNQDNVSSIIESKGRIMQAIMGLALVLSPVLVFSIINPSILNLSLNLPPLNTTTATPTQTTTTQSTTLSPTQLQARQSQGGTVISTFILTNPTQTSARDLGRILDTKQDECTAATSGLGIILPESGAGSGGGAFKYVCQTCPTNTKVRLNAKGVVGSGPRGSCVPN